MNLSVYLSTAGIAVLNGVAAGLCARSKAYSRYVAIVAVVSLAFLIFLCLPFGEHVTARHVVAYVLWTLPIPILLSLSPGLMVKKGSTFGWVFLAGMLTVLVVAAPFVFYLLILTCSIIGDCL
jgi:hypothetical protein